MLQIRALVVGSLLTLAGSAFAQTAIPSAEQMVEQLKAPPRTRSLRNLTIEAVPPSNSPGATSNTGSSQTTSDTAGDTRPAATGTPASVPTGTPAAMLEAAQVAARPSLSLSIQFDFDSARIRPESLLALGNLATALGSAALLPSRFVIEGHTDAKGNPDYNRKLSDQRAAAVRDLLLAKGIAATRLQSVGKGSSDLANPAAPQAAENRRVKIVNLD